jgi:cobalamin biosynthesis protein CbiG
MWKGKVDNANAQQLRYQKLERICLYIDWIRATTNAPSKKIVKTLAQVAKTLRVDEPTFIKATMKVHIDKVKKTIGLPETSLEAALKAHGLPLPTMDAKEMKIALGWKNRGIKRKAKDDNANANKRSRG